MDFRALGILEARRGGTLVALGGPRQQIVLSLLLAARGRVVSVDSLVDGLWGDTPPATARGQVQICISGLRRQLDPAAIRTRSPGYVLHLRAGDTSDLLRFDALEGQAGGLAGDDQLATLRAALDLWRGEPFSGLGACSDALHHLAVGLWERRSSLLIEYAELLFARGRYTEVIAELRAEVDRDPLSERFRSLLVGALTGAGRHTEALREFRLAEQLIASELGVPPSHELQALGRELIDGRQQAMPVRYALPVPRQQSVPPPRSPARLPGTEAHSVAVPRLLPPVVADFTGRADVVERLVGLLPPERRTGQTCLPPTAPVVVVTGGAGTGKTALAVRAAWQLAPRYPDGQLFADLGGSHRRDELAVLRVFLIALGVAPESLPDDVDGAVAQYRQLLAERRVLIVLDDAVDEEQLIPFVSGSPGCAVVVTSRRRLTAIPGVQHVELGPFRSEESEGLLRRMLGDERVAAEPDAARELSGSCGHLPLAIRIAGARLAARPHWRLSTMADRIADTGTRLEILRHGALGVRDRVVATLDALEPAARRLFARLGLLGAADFGEWVAATLLGPDDGAGHQPDDLLAALVETHLLDVRVVDGVPRYGMHDLIRAVARERTDQEDAPQDRTAALFRVLRSLLGQLHVAHQATHGGENLVTLPATEHVSADAVPWGEISRAPAAWLRREAQFVGWALQQAARLGLTDLACEAALRACPGLATTLGP